jgi:hypothetical protein
MIYVKAYVLKAQKKIGRGYQAGRFRVLQTDSCQDLQKYFPRRVIAH